MKEISTQLKEMRKQYRLTQKALSECTGIPARTIEDWESGKHNPPPYMLNLIEAKLSSSIVGMSEYGFFGHIVIGNLNVEIVRFSTEDYVDNKNKSEFEFGLRVTEIEETPKHINFIRTNTVKNPGTWEDFKSMFDDDKEEGEDLITEEEFKKGEKLSSSEQLETLKKELLSITVWEEDNFLKDCEKYIKYSDYCYYERYGIYRIIKNK